MPRAPHQHSFEPFKRIKRLLVKKCSCGATKSHLISQFNEEKAKYWDDLIKNYKQ